MKYQFVITGHIRPYTRMTRRGKFIKPAAMAYLANQEVIGWQLKEQMSAAGLEMLPDKTPLGVAIRAIMPGDLHKADSDNLVKAVCDAAQGIVYLNDKWIDVCYFTREAGNEYKTYFGVTTFLPKKGIAR